MPFVCQLGFDAPANLSQGLFIQYFGLIRTGGTNGCPLINGIIARIIWYFKWGFGHNHFWVSDLNGVRLIFVEF